MLGSPLCLSMSDINPNIIVDLYSNNLIPKNLLPR